MTESTESIFEQIPEQINENITKLIDRRIALKVPPIVQTIYSTPPEWFTNGINSIKSDVDSIKSDVNLIKCDVNLIKDEVSALREDMNNLERTTNTGFSMIQYKLALLDNVTRRNNGYAASSVPFINLESNQDELPPIETVRDIDNLNREECQKYLDGYNIRYRPNERALLKSKLRDAVGLVSASDLRYVFSNFSEEL